MNSMSKMKLLLVVLVLGTVLASCGLTNSNTRGKVVAPEEVAVTQIPFDTIHNLMIIEAEINGYPGRFLFDNGFTLSAISPDFAKKCGVDFNQSTTVNDINNKKTSLAETTLESIIIGGFDFQNTGFYRIDTKKFFPCDDVDGVIGGSIINKVNWKIFYDNRTIYISGNTFDFQDDATVIPVDYNRGNSALTDISVKGQEITCKIDIGMSGEMAIKKSKYLTLFEGEDGIKSEGISSLGATGLGGIEYNYDIASRTIIASDESDLSVGAEIELEQSQKYDGYIGIGYLRHYDLILNSTEKQYVVTNGDAPDDGDGMSYGINMYMINDTCRIITKNGFDPMLADIELMSAVKLIDDQPTSEFRSVCDLRTYMRKKIKSKTDLTLQLLDNEEPIVLPYREIVTGPVEE